MIVRATVVTGMPRWIVICAGVSVGLRWSLTLGRLAAAAARDRHVDRGVGAAEVPRRRGGRVAQRGGRAARQGCGHPTTLEREDSVADGVDASVQDVEPSGSKTPLYLAGGQPRL